MLFSVITICFNSEKVIGKTIESVLSQTYDNIEYIIVDGASADKTVEIAESFKDAFLKRGYSYKIISEKDNGIYDAMNKGIKNATGELIGLINSGDWYEPTMVETAVNTYKKTKFDMFFADINLVKENGAVIRKHSKYDKFPTSRHWNHPTTVIPKRVYDELGLYKNKGIHDDFEYLLRVKRNKKKIVIENKVLANFLTGGASNDKSFAKCKKRCIDRYHCYRDNGYSRFYIVECIMIELAKFIIS